MCELEGGNNERAQLVRRPTTSQLVLTYADTLGTILLIALDIDTDENLGEENDIFAWWQKVSISFIGTA